MIVSMYPLLRINYFDKISQAAKKAGKDSIDGYFDVSILDDFVKKSVRLGAFDHVRWGHPDLPQA